ncbi:hypothetical protein M569_12882 [Genlisea aurea]|uniref:RING-type E3 ubiquitin transferase n=1 Tax=Genlisea aurea TaxID=192259 RepID=S8DQ87_9LAMI|nr:hypothetical protein M569_12882 [Genlisea aurea]
MANNEEEVYVDDDGEPIRTAVGIDRDKNSQFAVKWAVENLKLKNKRILLVHVNAQKDVVKALCEFITRNSITAIALGSSNRGALARAFKYSDVPTSLAKFVSVSCSVYVVSKGKAVEMKVDVDLVQAGEQEKCFNGCMEFFE